ncbi:hypothetical protein [Marinobacter goseongensis]|uniref:hypothetical protein n=1 Tax=Marinobacter goseongensis TaxID=453838 RepID=UPI0020037157|nr:hypothetical protein [Marinobacter goseongensis]MCK7553341.1 hypothetical protein [Marinobacter goseongensis]
MTAVGCVANQTEPPEPQVPVAVINTGKLHYGVADVTPKSDTVLLAPANRHVVGSGHQIGGLVDYNATVIAPTRPPSPAIVVDFKKAAIQSDIEDHTADQVVSEPVIERMPAFQHHLQAPGAPATPMHPSRQAPQSNEQSEEVPGVPTRTPFDVAERKLDQINGGRLAQLPGVDMSDPKVSVWALHLVRYSQLPVVGQ